MAKYYALVTDKGMALYTNAGLVGTKVNITEFAVGDGGGSYYQPEPGMTALRHEVWRGAVTEYELDAESSFMANIYAVIPAQTGGFTIREMAAFDAAGNMVAIANTPDCLKATINDGVSSDMELCISVIMEHPKHGESNVDPDTVIVSRRYLEKVTGTPNGPASYEQGVTLEERAAIAANTSARHTHGNKPILDIVTQELLDKWNAAHTHISDVVKHITSADRTNWNDANNKKHTHANSAILTGITQALLDKWNAAYIHISDAIKHITAAERTAWNAKADKTYVDTSLENKANNGLGYAGDDLLEWAQSQPVGGSFMVAFDGSPANNPAPGHWLWGSLEKPHPNRSVIRVIVDDTGVEYVNHVANDRWFGWLPLATATPPQEYDLPLAAGLTSSSPSTHKNSFCKNQFGMVTLTVNIRKTDNGPIMAGTQMIGILPEGFRPDKSMLDSITINSESQMIPCLLGVEPDGSMHLHNYTNAVGTSYLQGVVQFYAM